MFLNLSSKYRYSVGVNISIDFALYMHWLFQLNLPRYNPGISESDTKIQLSNSSDF